MSATFFLLFYLSFLRHVCSIERGVGRRLFGTSFVLCKSRISTAASVGQNKAAAVLRFGEFLGLCDEVDETD